MITENIIRRNAMPGEIVRDECTADQKWCTGGVSPTGWSIYMCQHSPANIAYNCTSKESFGNSSSIGAAWRPQASVSPCTGLGVATGQEECSKKCSNNTSVIEVGKHGLSV